MKQSWRWFGPNDPVTLEDIHQTGATDIVSALHNIPIGEVWPYDKICQLKDTIEQPLQSGAKLSWSVVESIPVHEDIKLGKHGCKRYVENWISSMENLAKAGIKTICYNFMPVIDWTRTDLSFPLPNGAKALRFDYEKFTVFDLFILEREGAQSDYTEDEINAAHSNFLDMSEQEKVKLAQNITAGLPGRMTDSYDLDTFKQQLAQYKDITPEQLRQNLCAFLEKVLPKAEELGVMLAIHPDDPPRDLLGLPRIICTASDLEKLFTRLPSYANGITLCVGTYGSRPDNDLVEMANTFSERIHFAHLRGVDLDKDNQASFTEGEHLNSDANMVGIIQALIKEERRRVSGSEPVHNDIYIRPDHGHQLLDDMQKDVNPGYSCIGRLKGLAEIRGVIKTLEALN